MALIHLPDGTLSLQLVLVWWGVAIILIAIALRSARSQTIETKRLAIAGIIAAASFAVFQINIPFAGYFTIVLLIASYYVSIIGGGV